jgi:hypothetical protein
MPMLNPLVPAESSAIPVDMRDEWFGALRAAGERGDFLATLTIWVAAATV